MAILRSSLLLMLLLALFAGCSNVPRAKDGDSVKIHYTGRLEDGSTFDSSEGREPLAFTIGSGQVIAGFNDGVIGMAVGETKTITLAPEDAYGPTRDDMIRNVPRDQLPPDMTLEVGQILQMQGPGGRSMPVTIVAVEGDSVKLDANHPLAGKTLIFDLKLVEIAEK